jgi:hypothetical protein
MSVYCFSFSYNGSSFNSCWECCAASTGLVDQNDTKSKAQQLQRQQSEGLRLSSDKRTVEAMATYV